MHLTYDAEEALATRQMAKAEMDRLKLIIAACDASIMAVLDADEDAFVDWVREVRGEVQDVEKRRAVWTAPNGERYSVTKRKGAAPRSSISPEKLLQLGVPAHVIRAATTTGQPGRPGVSIRKIVNGFEDEGDDV